MNKDASLTPNTLNILRDKWTEKPYTSPMATVTNDHGTFLCRSCGAALFRAPMQFVSQCGWPSFDDELPGAIRIQPDSDGRREEIVCARCDGHLGHVFYGENYTTKNKRHCVNGLAVEWVPSDTVTDTAEIILAAGCFWGVEHWLHQQPGVLTTEVGYCGGNIDSPTYEQVCTKTTGHIEAVRVVFDTTVCSLDTLLQYFFEIHDFTQHDGQGPDIGPQYLSVIFYFNAPQQATALQVIDCLTSMGYQVATTLRPVTPFWRAEAYHQHYYIQQKQTPYCHRWRAIFSKKSQ